MLTGVAHNGQQDDANEVLTLVSNGAAAKTVERLGQVRPLNDESHQSGIHYIYIVYNYMFIIIQ